MDIVGRETRSRMMAGIRSKHTRPEILVRQVLHRLGFRFRLHDRHLPGRPDLGLRKYKAVINIHGCFWHGHTCRYFKVPKTNTDFWLKKIDGNRQRDQRVDNELEEQGWRVLTVWECAVRDMDLHLLGDAVEAWLIGWECRGELGKPASGSGVGRG